MDASEEAVFRVALLGNYDALLFLLRNARTQLEMIALVGCILGEDLSLKQNPVDEQSQEHRKCIDDIVIRSNLDTKCFLHFAVFCKMMRKEDLAAFFMKKSGREGKLVYVNRQKIEESTALDGEIPRICLITDDNEIVFRPFTILMHSMSTIKYAEKNIQSFANYSKSAMLFDAIECGEIETVKYIVSKGVEVDWTHVSCASWLGFNEISLYLDELKVTK